LGGHRDELAGPDVDLGRCLATRTAVAVELPAGIGFVDLARGQSLVCAVVDLLEQSGELRIGKTRELRRASSPLQGARVDGVERNAGESVAEFSRIVFAASREG
jgi:hypothetical protein